MSENRAGDGSLVFDTKINLDGFRKDLSQLEKLSETDIQVTGKAVLDKSDFESDVKELGRKSEKAVDTVTVETAVDDKGLKEDIAKLDDTAKRAVERLDSPISDGELTFDTRVDTAGVGNVMKGILGANFLQAGLEKAFEVGKKGVQLASDLEEVQNVVDVTFGQGAAQIEAFADSASTSFGLTELQAKQFSGTIGAMVKSMGLTEKEALDMSTSLVGLTGDMASFYNLDHQTAFDKIRSGLSGETEPLKQLGINMSVANLEAYALTKGIKKAYDEMSEAEKVQLRYGYIMQQTTDAQGDFVRTQDSYANQVRVLQNNLDTMAANVGGMLIPALTGAVGLVNELFAGPNTNTLVGRIDQAAQELVDIESELTALKNNYATTNLTIDVEYQRAQGLIADLEVLQNLPTQTDGTAQRMREITAALVEMYPQLEEYVGDDGLFRKEAAAVGDLVANMRELAKQQAYQTLVSGMKSTYTQGLVNYELLGAQYDEALQKMQGLQETIDALDAVDTVRIAADSVLKSGRMPTEYYQEMVDAINEYVAAFGGLERIDGEKINKLGIDLGGLFDGASLKDLDTLTAEGRMFDLMNLLQVISTTDFGENTIRENYAESKTALESAQTALEEQADSLLLAAEELETAEKLYEEKFGDGAEPIINYTAEAQAAIEEQSQKIKSTLSDGVVDGANEGVRFATANLNSSETLALYLSAGTNAGAAYGRAFSRAAKANMGIPYNVSAISYPGHATGLDYVPYDNYLARLHVGESVLTASEAQKWRENKGSGGVTPAQLTAAMAPVVDAIANIRIALDIDGRQFASNQAANTRTAQSQYGARIARGMGK